MVDEFANAVCGLLNGAGVFLAEQCFELGKSLFDWVEVWAVWRQENEFGASVADGTADRTGFVAAEIVHHHDIARPQRWDQEFFNPGQEAAGVDRPVEDARSNDTVTSQARDESQGFPVTMRHLGKQALANWAAAMQPCHICFGPCLIDKDNALRIDLTLQTPPLRAPAGDVRPVLLGRVQSFFYS